MADSTTRVTNNCLWSKEIRTASEKIRMKKNTRSDNPTILSSSDQTWDGNRIVNINLRERRKRRKFRVDNSCDLLRDASDNTQKESKSIEPPYCPSPTTTNDVDGHDTNLEIFSENDCIVSPLTRLLDSIHSDSTTASVLEDSTSISNNNEKIGLKRKRFENIDCVSEHSVDENNQNRVLYGKSMGEEHPYINIRRTRRKRSRERGERRKRDESDPIAGNDATRNDVSTSGWDSSDERTPEKASETLVAQSTPQIRSIANHHQPRTENVTTVENFQVEFGDNFGDTTYLPTVFENSCNLHEGKELKCIEREEMQRRFDIILAQNKVLRHRVKIRRDCGNRMTSIRHAYEVIRTLRKEKKKLEEENQSLTQTLNSTVSTIQNQMVTTMTAAVEESRRLNSKLDEAHKSIQDLKQKIRDLAGSLTPTKSDSD